MTMIAKSSKSFNPTNYGSDNHFATILRLCIVCALKYPKVAGVIFVGGLDGATAPPGLLPCCCSSVNQ